MIKAKHFDIRELVPERIYRERGQLAWELIDPNLIRAIDRLRERYGLIIINTWHSPKLVNAYGFRDQSGFRTREHYDTTEKYLSSLSQHKFGRAADCLPMETTAYQIRRDILAHPEEFPDITAVELDVPWLHIDTRNCDRIKSF
jgi:hypothetical protein